MASMVVPQELLDAGVDALSAGRWRYDDQEVERDELAHAVLWSIPDGWAKADGEWVRIESTKPTDPDEMDCCDSHGVPMGERHYRAVV